jgi:Flp pilus assembly protein TadB
MTLAIVCGALVGLGLYALIRVWLRPAPGVATLVHRIDAGTKSMSPQTVTQLEAGSASRVDSAMLLLAPVLWTILRVGGIPVPGEAPAVVALAVGALGFFLPDLALRSEAERRRADFRRVVGIFLDLVAMNLAGGRGLPEALLTASTISEHWALVRIRQALANARLFGTTPWAALGELGGEIGIEELRDLSAALTLAADDGAKIRQSLSARSATMRRRELADVEGEAGEKSQSMLVAQLVICTGFMVFLAYPAIAQLVGQ